MPERAAGGEAPEPFVFPKPVLVMSSCLDLQPVRYNGEIIRDDFVVKLRGFVKVVQVCPEMALGLGTPRPRILAHAENGAMELFQPATGRELTHDMAAFSESFLEGLSGIDGFLLKSKSPSCGVSGTKVYRYREGGIVLRKGRGLFAEKVLEKYYFLPAEDEGRLRNRELRDNFLTNIYAAADARVSLGRSAGMKDLVAFQSRYKYFLMAYNQKRLRELGKLTASYKKGDDLRALVDEYRHCFLEAIRRKPSRKQLVNALTHIFGHFSDRLGGGEKAMFLKLLGSYEKGVSGIHPPLSILKSWAIRFGDKYLLSQRLLEPFPEELYEEGISL